MAVASGPLFHISKIKPESEYMDGYKAGLTTGLKVAINTVVNHIL